MSELKNPLVQLKQLAKTDKKDEDFFKELEQQNKEKSWSFNPIEVHVENGILVHNAEEVNKAIKSLVVFIDKKIKTAKSVEDVEAMKKQSSTIHLWIEGSRKKITSPFDKLKTSFTDSEKLIKNIDFKTKIDELNEKVYKLRRASIIKELETLIGEVELESTLDIKVFEYFIDAKKKIKVFDLNTKDKLSAVAKKQVKEEFDKMVTPLIEAAQRQKDMQREHSQFAAQINQIKALPIEQRETQFEILRQNIEEQYTQIKESANAAVVAEIAQVKTQMRVAKEEEDRQVQQDLDEPILQEMQKINAHSEDLAYLEQTLTLASQDRDRIKSGSLRTQANYILQGVEQQIKLLKQRAILAPPPPLELQEQNTQEVDEIVQDGKYRLSEEDIEFMRSFRVEADSEDDAKVKMIEAIEMHFSMVELIKG